MVSFRKVLIFSGLFSIASLVTYSYLTVRQVKLDTIYIMSDVVLLNIFHQARKTFSKAYRRSQNNFRKVRRRLERRSAAYWQSITEYFTSLPGLYRESLESVVSDLGFTMKVFDDTMRFRKTDSAIYEACEEMREVINKGALSTELTPEVLKDILDFMRVKLDEECNSNEGLDIYHIVTLLEDEVFDTYHYEVEVIERSYDLYLSSFKEFDIIFQTIGQCKLIPSLDSCL